MLCSAGGAMWENQGEKKANQGETCLSLAQSGGQPLGAQSGGQALLFDSRSA